MAVAVVSLWMDSKVVFTLQLRAYYHLHASPPGLPDERSLCRVDEARQMAYEMLGNRLITKQTGPTGQLVDKVSSDFYDFSCIRVG